MLIGNQDSFWFSLSDVGIYFVLCALGLFAVLTALCALLPGKAGNVVTALVFSAGLALWIESTLMPMDYGLLDGKAVNWRAYSGRMIIDAAIWLICIAGPVVLSLKNSRFFKRAVALIGLFIVTMQAGSLAVSLLSKPKVPGKSYVLGEDGKFTLSTRQNIVVFVLDAFEKRLFNKIAAENTEYFEVFKDFTLYDDATSGHCYTRPAIPFILTGRMYDNSLRYVDYLVNSYREVPIFRILQEHNYDNRVYTYPAFIMTVDPALNEYFNATPGVIIRNWPLLIKLMYKLTAFRYVPVVFKNSFWMYTDDFEAARAKKTPSATAASPDLLFYRTLLAEGITLIHDKNAFRFFHLRGAHQPWTLTEGMEEKKDEISFSAQYGQAKATLKIVRAYLEEMKRTGVYKNSTIILTADHGFYSYMQFVTYKIPLLMVKTPGTRKGLAISKAPVTTGDVAATILSFVTPDYRKYGPSLFDVKENEPRERRFLFGREQEYKDYMADLTEWKTTGNAEDMASWKKTGRIFAAGKTIQAEPPDYIPGTRLIFEKNSKSYSYAEIGLLESPSNLAYTIGDMVKMSFKTGRINGSMALKLRLAGALDGPIPVGHRIGLLVNGKRLPEEFRISELVQDVSFHIPKNFFGGEIQHLTLLCPDAQFMDRNKDTVDPLKFSFYLYSLVLDFFPPLKPGKVIDFSLGGEGRQYLRAGWNYPGPRGTWSTDKAELLLPIEPGRDVQLEIGLLFSYDENYISVSLNGKPLCPWAGPFEIIKGIHYKTLVLPKDYLESHGLQSIEFNIPNAHRPDPNRPGDSRILGIPLASIKLLPPAKTPSQ